MDSAHTNPEPATNSEPKPAYPTNHVVGVVESADQVTRSCEGLRAEGFSESDIQITHGKAAADRLEASTGRSGLENVAVRIAERLSLADEEMITKDMYEEALRNGSFVVAVAAGSDDRKERASRVLLTNGGQTVKHLGRFTIEDIHP